MPDARARHASLTRILAVQAKKRTLEQWKEADYRRRASEASDAEAALIAALNAETPLSGLFPEQAARRLESLSKSRRSLEAALERQAEAVRAEARREKAAEILVAEAARAVEDARRRLADLEALEAFLARAGSEDAPRSDASPA